MIAADASDMGYTANALPIFFAQADVTVVDTTSQRTQTLTVGLCGVYSSATTGDDTPYNGGPVFEAATALNRILGTNMMNMDNPVRAEVVVASQPRHGKLVLNSFPDGGTTYDYRSDIGYVGKESFTLLVSIEGKPPVKIIYFFTIVRGGPDDDQIKKYCGTTGINLWKISELSFSPHATGLAAWQRSANLSALIASARHSFTEFSNLAGTALGSTMGHGINRRNDHARPPRVAVPGGVAA